MPADPIAAEPAAAFVSRWVGWILVVSGSISLVAATVLMVEKVRMLEDPTRVPSCTIDEVLACGAVMNSAQAEAFGFPNPLLGIAGFAALVALGVAVSAGSALRRGVWLAVQGGLTFAVGFVHWLFFQTVYEIGALCPYCMVVWVMTITAFVYVTAHNLAASRLRLPRVVANVVVRYHGVVVTAWLGLLTVLIGEAFWAHWRTVLA